MGAATPGIVSRHPGLDQFGVLQTAAVGLDYSPVGVVDPVPCFGLVVVVRGQVPEVVSGFDRVHERGRGLVRVLICWAGSAGAGSGEAVLVTVWTGCGVSVGVANRTPRLSARAAMPGVMAARALGTIAAGRRSTDPGQRDGGPGRVPGPDDPQDVREQGQQEGR